MNYYQISPQLSSLVDYACRNNCKNLQQVCFMEESGQKCVFSRSYAKEIRSYAKVIAKRFFTMMKPHYFTFEQNAKSIGA